MLFPLVLIAAMAGPFPGAEEPEADAAFEGRWEYISRHVDGRLAEIEPRRLLIRGPLWEEAGGECLAEWVVERAGAGPFPRFTRFKNRRTSLRDTEVRSCVGIYQLDKDELRFATTITSRNRPTSIEPGAGRAVDLYRRIKEAEKDEEFEGTWRLIRESKDEDTRYYGPSPRKLVVKDGRWFEESNGERFPWRVTRGDGVPWSTIDVERWTVVGTGVKAEAAREGVLYIDGETLILSFGDQRPKTVLPGKGRVVETYSRVKSPREEKPLIEPPKEGGDRAGPR